MIEALVYILIVYLFLAIYLIHRLQKCLAKTTDALVEERGRVARIKLVVRLVADSDVYDKIEGM